MSRSRIEIVANLLITAIVITTLYYGGRLAATQIALFEPDLSVVQAGVASCLGVISLLLVIAYQYKQRAKQQESLDYSVGRLAFKGVILLICAYMVGFIITGWHIVETQGLSILL